MSTEVRTPQAIRSGRLTVGTYQFGGQSWLEVAGEVDETTATALLAEFDQAARGLPAILVVDLVDVTSFGADGLNALVSLDRHRDPGTDLRLIPSAPVRRALADTGPAGTFALHESRAAAMRYLNAHQPHRVNG